MSVTTVRTSPRSICLSNPNESFYYNFPISWFECLTECMQVSVPVLGFVVCVHVCLCTLLFLSAQTL